jgi:hypothetical protein
MGERDRLGDEQHARAGFTQGRFSQASPLQSTLSGNASSGSR